jgi:type IV pilus assembly protein PilP
MSKRLGKKGINSSLLLGFVLVFFAFEMVLASQDVIYKEPRPPKEMFKGEKELGRPGEAEGEKKKEVTYIYDPTGKTDPFKSFIAIQEEMEEKKKRKPRTYLETVDLSQLELSVIITSEKGNWAMVRDSKGLGHVIKKGTYIGTNGGIVHEITDKAVIIREEYRDFRGRKKFKDIPKSLPSLR